MEHARVHVFNNGCREAILPSNPQHLQTSARRTISARWLREAFEWPSSEPSKVWTSACRRSHLCSSRSRTPTAAYSMASFGMPKVREQDEASACRSLGPPKTHHLSASKKTNRSLGDLPHAEARLRHAEGRSCSPSRAASGWPIEAGAFGRPKLRRRRQGFGMSKALTPRQLKRSYRTPWAARILCGTPSTAQFASAACRTSFPFHLRSTRRTHAGRPVEPTFWRSTRFVHYLFCELVGTPAEPPTG